MYLLHYCNSNTWWTTFWQYNWFHWHLFHYLIGFGMSNFSLYCSGLSYYLLSSISSSSYGNYGPECYAANYGQIDVFWKWIRQCGVQLNGDVWMLPRVSLIWPSCLYSLYCFLHWKPIYPSGRCGWKLQIFHCRFSSYFRPFQYFIWWECTRSDLGWLLSSFWSSQPQLSA